MNDGALRLVRVKLEQDENGDLLLPLSEEVLKSVGWKVGDIIIWNENKDGTFTLTKKNEQSEKNLDLLQIIN